MPQTSDPLNLGQAGLLLSGLALLLYHKSTPAAAPAPDSGDLAGVTLVELSEGFYYFAGLPDPPSIFDSYLLSVALSSSPSNVITTYRWGFSTAAAAPDSVSSVAAGWMTQAVPIAIRHGSLLPLPACIVNGLTADPTGATASFALTPYGGGTAAALNGTVGMSISRAGLVWGLQLWYNWAAADYSEGSNPVAPGLYVGYFTVTLPSAEGTFQAPANDQLRVRVV